MKNCFKFIGLGLFIAAFLTGCSQPVKEMDAAKAAVHAASSEGGEIYAKQELETLRTDLDAAMDMIDAKGKGLFKSYGEAKVMLAAITLKAEELKAVIPTRKEEAKNAASVALDEAKTVVEEAKMLLADAPRGKGTKADIDAYTSDLKGLEDMVPEILTKIDNEDFLGAAESAQIIKEKATAISEQIRLAMDKIKKK